MIVIKETIVKFTPGKLYRCTDCGAMFFISNDVPKELANKLIEKFYKHHGGNANEGKVEVR